MTAILKRIDDPRTPLDKARRMELYRFAQQNGVAEITQDMPAILMRQVLRNRGLVNINVPPRVLGQPNGHAISDTPAALQDGPTVDAADDLLRQWKQEKPAPAPVETDARGRPKQEINFLRDECRRLNIKMERRDNLKTLRAKVAEAKEALVKATN